MCFCDTRVSNRHLVARGFVFTNPTFEVVGDRDPRQFVVPRVHHQVQGTAGGLQRQQAIGYVSCGRLEALEPVVLRNPER